MTDQDAPPARSRKRRLLLPFLFSLPILLVLGVILLGRFLPSDYHGRVTAHFSAPPAEVWAALSDFQTTPVSGPMRVSTTVLESENGLPTWVEDIGESRVTVRTEVADEPTRLVRRYEDDVVPMRAQAEYVLEPDGDGTRVVATNHIELSSGTWHGPFFRLILTVTGGAGASLQQHLGGVGTALGESPAFEG